MSVPAIVGTARRGLVRRLTERRAFSSSTAVPLLADSFIAQRQLTRLLAEGVIRQEQPGRYWLDQAKWEAYSAIRFRKALAVLAALIAATVGFLLLKAR